jgi:GTP-binding protein
MIIDSAVIEVRSGPGGDGAVSFRREKGISKGGPYGGDGGRGGSVILLADSEVETLLDFSGRHHWKAQNGEKGGRKGMHGADGADLLIRVPVGTLIYNEPVAGELPKEVAPETDMDAYLDEIFLSGTERAAIHAPEPDSKPAGDLIVDMHTPGMRFVIAQGGKGGLGNKAFKTSTHQTPREAEPGGEYECKRLRLELKLMADVGLLGKPNAGKSTLLCRVSKATPKIAPYPFTTLRPHLGIAEVGAAQAGARPRRLVVADMPGLIENAHLGAGMGIRFLRHVERTRVLLHVLEPHPTDETEIIANYKAIRTALKGYDKAGNETALAKKPEVVVISKSDLMEPGEEAALVKKVQKATKAKKVFVMSAATGEGVREVLEECWRVCDSDKKAELQAAEDEIDVLAASGWDAKAADTRAPAKLAKQREKREVNKTIKSMKTAAVKNEAAAPAKKLKRGLGKNKQKKTTKASIKKYVPKK